VSHPRWLAHVSCALRKAQRAPRSFASRGPGTGPLQVESSFRPGGEQMQPEPRLGDWAATCVSARGLHNSSHHEVRVGPQALGLQSVGPATVGNPAS